MSTALRDYIVPRYRIALVREGEHPAIFPAACTCTEKAQLICEEYFQGIDSENYAVTTRPAGSLSRPSTTSGRD